MQNKKTISMGICPKCNEKLISERRENSIVISCPNCGIVMVGDVPPDYAEDMTLYTIVIDKNIEFTKEQMKYISKVCQVNYIDAKKILENGKYILKKGTASDLKELIQSLSHQKIKYSINPKFKYIF